MAYLQTHPSYDFSVDEAVRRINAARKRESITALAVGILAVIVFGSVIYLSFHNVPAPETPGNAASGIGQPYH